MLIVNIEFLYLLNVCPPSYPPPPHTSVGTPLGI